MLSLVKIAFFLIIVEWLSRYLRQRPNGPRWRDSDCATPPSLPSRDAFFNLDNVKDMLQTLAENRRIRSIYEQSHKYGWTHQWWPFGTRLIQTSDPKIVLFIHAIEPEKFGIAPQRENATGPLIGHGLITSDEPIWSFMRPLLKPIFTRTQISDRVAFDIHVSRFMDLLPVDGSTINLRPLLESLILYASSEFIFGESFDSQMPIGERDPNKSIDSRSFIDAFNYGMKEVGKRIIFGKLSFLIRDPLFWSSCRFVQDTTRAHIERVMRQIHTSGNQPTDTEGSRSKTTLLRELLEKTQDLDVLCSQLLNVFFAGRDAPAIALTSIFFILSRHPQVWAQIRQEVQGLQPENLFFEKLKSLRYVQHTISEVFRLYPPLANNSRICLQEAILPSGGGADGTSPIRVFPRDTISVSYYTLHRRADFFEDPEVFRPERWQTLRTTWEFLPFAGGPRHCPAQQLALFWIGYVVVRMALRFRELKNMDPVNDFVEEVKLNLQSRNGAIVALIV
ncbi:cytochrome P450 [Lophiostoma macrostomum CBS 122681]|uniref:Cytochrome P450 n=1 Tax=Lophiostoma macrostomum CBS 122681 TaxID=1314788 RepID=A0A6A6SQK9_9PLEO|nr:cytochrome P450 [Lophiostoma macrostomum CBS 122681]